MGQFRRRALPIERARPGAQKRRPRVRLALVLGLLGLLDLAAQAQSLPAGSARHVEAAYLLNFLRFCEWPPSATGAPGEPLHIAVVGSERAVEAVREVAAAAGPIDGRAVQVHDVDYRRRRDRDAPAQARALRQLRDSHLVFVDRSAAAEMRGVLRDLLGLPVLTVGNVDGFLQAGGMLELLPSGRNIVFAAAPDAIHDAGLVLSAKVLKMAHAPGEEG